MWKTNELLPHRPPPLLVLLLLVLQQLVDLPLGHGGVLGDETMLVQAWQQQQETHCDHIKNRKLSVLQPAASAPDHLRTKHS